MMWVVVFGSLRLSLSLVGLKGATLCPLLPDFTLTQVTNCLSSFLRGIFLRDTPKHIMEQEREAQLMMNNLVIS